MEYTHEVIKTGFGFVKGDKLNFYCDREGIRIFAERTRKERQLTDDVNNPIKIIDVNDELELMTIKLPQAQEPAPLPTDYSRDKYKLKDLIKSVNVMIPSDFMNDMISDYETTGIIKKL